MNTIVSDSIAPMALYSAKADIPKGIQKDADDAAQKFAGLFIGSMLAPMMDGLKTDGIGGGGHGEKLFRHFLTKAIGEEMGKTGFMDCIKDSIKSELVEGYGKQITGGKDEAARLLDTRA
ncbi:MAG: hypothetical protein ACPGXY_06430 [Alphaproteobacteria bacterium]